MHRDRRPDGACRLACEAEEDSAGSDEGDLLPGVVEVNAGPDDAGEDECARESKSRLLQAGEEDATKDELFGDRAENAYGENAGGVMEKRVVAPDGEIPRAAPLEEGVGAEHPEGVEGQPAEKAWKGRRVEGEDSAIVGCAAARDRKDEAYREERRDDFYGG